MKDLVRLYQEHNEELIKINDELKWVFYRLKQSNLKEDNSIKSLMEYQEDSISTLVLES